MNYQFLGFVLGSIGMFSFSPNFIHALEDLKILSHSSFIDILGIYNIEGEVQNNSTNAIKFPVVLATLYDSNGQIIGTGAAPTSIEPLDPGQKCSFKIMVVSASVPLDQVSNYSLHISQ